jgi:hypothetical protein
MSLAIPSFDMMIQVMGLRCLLSSLEEWLEELKVHQRRNHEWQITLLG